MHKHHTVKSLRSLSASHLLLLSDSRFLLCTFPFSLPASSLGCLWHLPSSSSCHITIPIILHSFLSPCSLLSHHLCSLWHPYVRPLVVKSITDALHQLYLAAMTPVLDLERLRCHCHLRRLTLYVYHLSVVNFLFIHRMFRLKIIMCLCVYYQCVCTVCVCVSAPCEP